MPEAIHSPIAVRAAPSSEIAQSRASQRWKKFSSWPSVARLRLLLCFILAGVMLTACGSLSPSPPGQREPTELELLIEASERLNPDPQGRAAPILLRIYELRSADAFQEADFFALYQRDRATLGSEALVVDQFILRPGQAQMLHRQAHPETRYIGVVAGYRELPISTWRVLYRLPATPELKWYSGLTTGSTSTLRIDLQSNNVLITDLARTSNLATMVHRSDGAGTDLSGLNAEAKSDTPPLGQPPSMTLDALPGMVLPSEVKVPMPETPGPFHQQPSLRPLQGPLEISVPAKSIFPQ